MFGFKDEPAQFSPAVCVMGLCLLQVFALQSSLLQLHPPDHVRLAVVDFLSSMGKVFIPQEAQVNGIVALMKLPCLLIKILLFKYTVKESIH